MVDAARLYRDRLARYAKVEVVEVAAADLHREEPTQIQRALDDEAQRLGSRWDGAHRVVMAPDGRPVDSPELARLVERYGAGGGLALVVGGSHGVAKQLRDQAHEVLSLGRITLPHELFRVVLLEQLYRACTILNREPYHK